MVGGSKQKKYSKADWGVEEPYKMTLQVKVGLISFAEIKTACVYLQGAQTESLHLKEHL